MKKLFLSATLLFSLSSFAEVIKLHDGTLAKCESLMDVAAHTLSGVYRPLSYKRTGDLGVVKIEFLSCIENSGKFSFKRDMNFTDKVVRPVMNPDASVHIERSKLEVVVTNENGDLLRREPLLKNQDGSFSATLALQNISVDQTLDFHVQTLMKMTDVNTNEVIDQGQDAYGSFRIKSK